MSITSFDTLKFIEATKQLPEYAHLFATAEDAKVVAAFEFMLHEYQMNGDAEGIYEAVGDKFTKDVVGVDTTPIFTAIAAARVLFAAYLKQAETAVAFETVPLTMSLEYEYSQLPTGKNVAYLKGFKIMWLKRPVDANAVKEGLVKLLRESGYILSVTTYSSAVEATLPYRSMISSAELVQIINEIFLGSGYEFNVLNRVDYAEAELVDAV